MPVIKMTGEMEVGGVVLTGLIIAHSFESGGSSQSLQSTFRFGFRSALPIRENKGEALHGL